MNPGALRVLRAGALSLVAGLAGCAMPGHVGTGLSQAEVQARLGAPTAIYPLAQGTRWQYSQMPAGSEVHNLDFDASGHLLHTEQVLTQARWDQLAPGTSAHDVLRVFGAPMRRDVVSSFVGSVWTYRFRHLSDLRLAHVHIDLQGVVRMVQFTDEFPNIHDRRD